MHMLADKVVPLKLMSQAVEGTWIHAGGYGWFMIMIRGEYMLVNRLKILLIKKNNFFDANWLLNVIVTAQCQSVIRVKVTDAFNIRQGLGSAEVVASGLITSLTNLTSENRLSDLTVSCKTSLTSLLDKLTNVAFKIINVFLPNSHIHAI